MNRFIAVLITTLLLASNNTYADAFYQPEKNTFYGGIGNGITRTDISHRSDDENEVYLKAFTGIQLTRNIGIELGGLWFDDITIDGKDAVGKFEVNLERYDFYLGPTLQFKPHWFIPIRVMAGASYSRLNMQVKESFYYLAPSGKTTANDHVTGTYLSLGIVPFQKKYLSALVSIDYIKRPDFFEQSTRPMEIKDTAINFRLSFY